MTSPPIIEPRSYQDLVDEALARIPVHNPEWTNFNRSDPGVTLLELFAFLTEALGYRANQIPERSRAKFLSLLQVPMAPAASATGIIEVRNERGPLATVTLAEGLEVRAGQVAFRTTQGLDVVPVESVAVVKQRLVNPPPELRDYYRQLYAAQRGQPPDLDDVDLYQTTPVSILNPSGTALHGTVDNALWIALLLRPADPPTEDSRTRARAALAGATISLGIVPVIEGGSAYVGPSGLLDGTETQLGFQIPQPPPDGLLPVDGAPRRAGYRSLDARSQANVLSEPGVVQLSLPDDPDALGLWANLDPLEAGAADFPPNLEDSTLAGRLLTWIKVAVPHGAEATVLWAGVNAAMISQRARVVGEPLPDGTGEPDQTAQLAHPQVLPETVSLEVTPPYGAPERWERIDDLLAAGAEVQVRDVRLPPGGTGGPERNAYVFAVDAVSGAIRFGDGVRGRRPPDQATLRVDYDYGAGAQGNVGAGAVDTGPNLPAGIKVSNPLPTWGGAEAETVAEAERQASRYLQHRDRLVSAEDFETIVRRAPGVQVGRVDVLPTYNPQVTPAVETPGAVTVLVLPHNDPRHPAAPEPDRLFLNTICRYLAPRRLVTTELFLRGPTYVDIWISIGVDVEAGRSLAVTYDAVRAALTDFLAPLTAAPGGTGGWPLGKAVQRLELAAVASRVPGVRLVDDVRVAAGSAGPADQITITGLELPRVRAIAVGPHAADLDQVRGQQPPPEPPPAVPVPVVPEEC